MGNGTRLDLDGILVCYACGTRHDNAVAKHLPDGTLVGLHSTEWAMYCQARFVLSQPLKIRREILDGVERSRGKDGRKMLENEILRWHKKGK